MPAVTVPPPSPHAPEYPPRSSLLPALLQPLESSSGIQQQQFHSYQHQLQLSTNTAAPAAFASRGLLLAAPVVVAGSLLIAALRWLGRKRRAPRHRLFSGTDAKKPTAPGEPFSQNRPAPGSVESELVSGESARPREPLEPLERPAPDEPAPSTAPAQAPPPARRLRLRVYHLREPLATGLATTAVAATTMDEALRGLGSSCVVNTTSPGATSVTASAGTPVVDGVAAAFFSSSVHELDQQQQQHRFPHPPPLPLSTSSIAFHREMAGPEPVPTEEGSVAGLIPADVDVDVDVGAEADADADADAKIDAQMMFIYQPNPDYLSDVNVDADPGLGRGVEEVGRPSADPSTSPPSFGLGESTGSPQSADLPPALPSAPAEATAPDGRPSQEDTTRDIAVQGKIVSVLDDAGAGWSRHTRVYGGGVCLACLAAEGSGGGGSSSGGVYGDSVPLEDRR